MTHIRTHGACELLVTLHNGVLQCLKNQSHWVIWFWASHQ